MWPLWNIFRPHCSVASMALVLVLLGTCCHPATAATGSSGIVEAASAVNTARISNSHWDITVALNDPAYGGITYLLELRYFQPAFQEWTVNLAFAFKHLGTQGASNARLSTTSISLGDDHTWLPATGGAVNSSNATSLVISKIRLGDVAEEEWLLTLGGAGGHTSGLQWDVQRTYLKEVRNLTASRYQTFSTAAQYTTTGEHGAAQQAQVPSTVDPSFVWNTTGLGFNVQLGNVVPNGDAGFWTYSYTPLPESNILMSPSSVVWNSSFTASSSSTSLAFQWPWYPGTGAGDTSIAIGLIANPALQPHRAGGERESVSWTLVLADTAVAEGRSPVHLNTNDEAYDRLARSLGTTFNMWTGNFLSNSPSSCTCIFELGLFPQMASVFAPPMVSPADPRSQGNSTRPLLHQALRHMLSVFANTAVWPDGYVYPIWQQYRYLSGSYVTDKHQHDQVLHFLLGYYHYAVLTGDKDFIIQVWPTLMKVMDYVLYTMQLSTGLATTPGVSGNANTNNADNWFDVIDFGGKDAIINGLAVQALKGYADLARWLGHPALSERFRRLHQQSVAAFNHAFWNEEESLFSDWVDEEGKKHDFFYMYTQSLAIEPLGNITTKAQRQAMLRAFDRNYRRIYAQTNTSSNELWCTPTNFVSTGPLYSFKNGTLQNQKVFGNYENGACFMLFGAMELAARGYGGDGAGSLKRFRAILDKYNSTRLWGQHYNWLKPTGRAFVGADVLTNTVMSLRGFIHGAFGFLPTLLDGVQVVAEAAPRELEGASHDFYHLGSLKRVTIVNGKAECSLQLTVLSIDGYLRPAEEIPKLDSGAANMSHEEAVNWQRVAEDLQWERFQKDDAGFSSPDEVVLIADDRVAGYKPLVDAAARILICSSSEAGCFQDCILARVALQEYTGRIWPTHTRRARQLLKWAQEARSTASKMSILDEACRPDEYRGQLSSEELTSFAARLVSRFCRESHLGEVSALRPRDIPWWLARVEGPAAKAPERTVRQLQQVRKNVISGFESAARRFAAQVTQRLIRGSRRDAESALQELADYRLSQQAMSQEERARWSSVLCTREVGPGGEILSVEVLRWAWARLKELHSQPAAFSHARPQLDLVLSINAADEDLIPFRILLAADADKLEHICLAVDMVLFFGRLHFLRQRMWDACPSETAAWARKDLAYLDSGLCEVSAFSARAFETLETRDRSLTPPALSLARALQGLARPLLEGEARIDL
ncbi:unnamed protein product [Symbiodinium natans]|uniref:Glycosyl-hydrolase family 116 catalytic region domain-containing protein n=1 Tax=Symbiodinium natans TaxID=878477 RepID=A0A812M2L2_9DINO|nr:unnamed protein product [Symbiodinium natans]